MKHFTLLSLATFLLSASLYGATLGEDIKNNSLIVYNSNIGLVHEERTLELTQSDTQIVYNGIASNVETDSVNISLPQGVTLYSQQYRFDKLTLQKLLDAHIGKKVEVRLLKNQNEFKIITATLLSSSGSKSLVRTLDFKILSVASSAIRFEEIPSALITKPSLVWNIKAKEYIKSDMKLDYLVKGISFKSDYILRLNDTTAKLTGWITLKNRSGKSFKNTRLSLLAGDINRVSPNYTNHRMLKASRISDTKQTLQQKSFEGYHFYTIPFDVNIANNETTQIKFIEESNITIERLYTSRLSNPLFLQGESKKAVSQYVKLSALSMPLPKGVVRTYATLQNQTILLAENSIEHTAKQQDIRLKLGKNFDTQVTQTVLSRQDTSSTYSADVLYTLRNSSDEDKTISLLIPFNKKRDSKIVSDKTYHFTEGNMLTFDILVPANSTKKFNTKYESSK
jgi:hypothetical protein